MHLLWGAEEQHTTTHEMLNPLSLELLNDNKGGSYRDAGNGVRESLSSGKLLRVLSFTSNFCDIASPNLAHKGLKTTWPHIYSSYGPLCAGVPYGQ